MTLGYPIAQGDGIHFEGNSARYADSRLRRFGQGPEMNVPGIHFRPGVDDPDERFLEIGICEAKGSQESTVGGPLVSPVQYIASFFHIPNLRRVFEGGDLAGCSYRKG